MEIMAQIEEDATHDRDSMQENGREKAGKV